jgi:hypothetical protein
MSHLKELAAQCAVHCKKSENMRLTASTLACEAIAYLKTSAGIMEAHAAWCEPNARGFFQLVQGATRPDDDGKPVRILPQGLGSFRSFQRLLQIAGDENKDADLRQRQAAADKARRQPAPESGADCNSAGEPRIPDVAPWISLDLEEISQAQPPSLALAQAVIKALSLADFEAFKLWFRNYAGSPASDLAA